jgi:hypothetical protein
MALVWRRMVHPRLLSKFQIEGTLPSRSSHRRYERLIERIGVHGHLVMSLARFSFVYLRDSARERVEYL